MEVRNLELNLNQTDVLAIKNTVDFRDMVQPVLNGVAYTA